MSFLVARREREMGIRLALGATGRGLEVFVLSIMLRWVAAGVLAGIAAALLAAQYLKPFVYQIPANDPRTLAIVATAVTLVAGVAGYLPARRLSRIDPAVAFRQE